MAALTAMKILHPEALSAAAQEVLRSLASRPSAPEAYLAGSAALALYIGHRTVRDLDWMTPTNRLTGPERRDLLAELQSIHPPVRVETARDGFLFVRFASGAGVKFFHYPYPLVDPEEEFAGLLVASAADLGLMKLAAIISRGGRRDFADLYLLCRHLPLADLLARAPEKYGHVGDFTLQALKGLADLSATAGEPLPLLLQPLDWAQVEAWLTTEVRALGRAHAGLSPP